MLFHITPSTSRLQTSGAIPAFGNPGDDTPGADTLIVDASAYLIAIDTAREGAFLPNTGAWTVTVNGVVVSENFVALNLQASDPAVSTITIGKEGEVGSINERAIELASAANLNNAGLITGGDKVDGTIEIDGPGTHKITNSGTIMNAGGFAVRDNSISTNTLKNSGAILGDILFANGADTLTNSGTITGHVNLSDGVNHLSNSGSISDYTGGLNDDTVTNSKTINGGVGLSDGVNHLTNSGTIGINVDGGLNDDTVVNSGKIAGHVSLSDGTNHLTNSGSIGGDYIGGLGSDIVVNSGSILGAVNLGDGADKFTGGSHGELVFDGGGSDIVQLGGGGDQYVATNSGFDGTDTIDGGAGIDMYNAGFASDFVAINLDTIQHGFNALVLAGNTAIGSKVAGAQHDTITNFENAITGDGSDLIFGNAAVNFLDGDTGDDILVGLAGNDTLQGGNGNDILDGGRGKDILTSGKDSDQFVYDSIKDSGVTTATRDEITDFEHNIDVVNLSGLAVFTGYLNGDSSVTPATVFTGVAGQLRSYWNAAGQIVEGDVNGDKVADFSIQIDDPSHFIHLTSTDFVL